MVTGILGCAVLAVIGLALFSAVRSRKKGGCCGCEGCSHRKHCR